MYDKDEKKEWLYDCRVCEHITNNKNLLTNFIKSPSELSCANDSKSCFKAYR